MTGRRLYEHYVDACASEDSLPWTINRGSVLPHADNPPVAWPFLSARDRKVWNNLARRITPKRRTA